MKNITLITLLIVATNASAAEVESRNQVFNAVFTLEKERIMALPAYAIARQKFAQFLKVKEEQEKQLIAKMHQDKDYQNAFAAIKEEIKNAGTMYKNMLSDAEAQHLITALTKQFIPQ